MDDNEFPIVVLTLQGSLTDQHFYDMLDEMEKVRERGRLVVITDTRRLVGTANAAQRKIIADWMNRMEKKHPPNAASIVILNSALVRGALTALQWLSRTQQKDIYVQTMDEAKMLVWRIVGEELSPSA